jgi:lysophospholipase L1-like esterase
LNYQNIVCWGDSQTFGARSYGCYPLHLVRMLNASTRYVWRATNLSTNGATVRDLWFRLGTELPLLRDTSLACILMGTNDVGRRSPLDLFEEYYRQSLQALRINRYLAICCGEIPPIFPDGHAYFHSDTATLRDAYNVRLRSVVAECANARLVTFPDLTVDCYTDPVHLNETGNERVANAFAAAIRSF